MIVFRDEIDPSLQVKRCGQTAAPEVGSGNNGILRQVNVKGMDNQGIDIPQEKEEKREADMAPGSAVAQGEFF
jgi:hypothetical protein